LRRRYARIVEIVMLRFRNLKPILNKLQEELTQDFSVDRKMNGTNRRNIIKGTHVKVVRKEDQRSGKLTEGIVKDVLTNSAVHPHGIKVRLVSGVVGRVKEVLPET
jgi:uncharacterized repeat protein (TIGR03833 family)